MTDLQELRRLAEEATRFTNEIRAQINTNFQQQVACDPATILSLLTELELARAVVEAAPFATADCDGLDVSCPFCLALAAYRAAYPAKEGA